MTSSAWYNMARNMTKTDACFHKELQMKAFSD